MCVRDWSKGARVEQKRIVTSLFKAQVEKHHTKVLLNVCKNRLRPTWEINIGVLI